MTKAKYDALPTISTANAENDDWMQKSNPEAYKRELAIHDELARRYAAEKKKQSNGEGRSVPKVSVSFRKKLHEMGQGNFGHAGIPGHRGGSSSRKGKEERDYDAYKVPEKGPNGAVVVGVPPKNSLAERRGIKKGMIVTGEHNELGGSFFRITGRVDGFCGDDVMINDGKGKFAFISGKNVFPRKVPSSAKQFWPYR
jgi:hypothetical protein